MKKVFILTIIATISFALSFQGCSSVKKIDKENEAEQMFVEAFSKGYIQLENLQITTLYLRVEKEDISTKSSIGGFHDWRLPSISEYMLIYSILESYYDKKDAYSEEASQNIEKLWSYFTNNRGFWVSEGGACEGANDYTSATDDDCQLMLVREQE